MRKLKSGNLVVVEIVGADEVVIVIFVVVVFDDGMMKSPVHHFVAVYECCLK